ncbi:hypothetical protein E4U15_007350 [Claviceps sp. LM218 group G6]|nr:hypothetical protein E4U15_007350 [Claviceps sp. LM218 group G6]
MASRIRRNWQATTDGQLFKDTIFWFAHDALRKFEAQESERTSSTARSEEDRAESEVDYEDQIDQFYRKQQHEVRDYG